ncbi:MAG: hypothetical protein HFF62_14990 [Oscillospiraceae bacterium]|nr:hypothetical protein [Oscillospiraceae bacterium]
MSNLTAWKRATLLASKIALGSSLAIYTAEFLHLEILIICRDCIRNVPANPERMDGIRNNLQNEMRKLKTIPRQAKVVVEYIRYMNQYVAELNEPELQLERLDEIFQQMEEEPLPTEFESRALLYHILMDLEEFLPEKQQFLVKEGKISV